MPLSEIRSISSGSFPPGGKSFHLCVEASQITVVDSYHVNVLVYIFQFLLVVDFQQDFQFKFMGFEGQGFALLFLQSGGYKKDSVRSYDACLIKLVFIYNEIFP